MEWVAIFLLCCIFILHLIRLKRYRGKHRAVAEHSFQNHSANLSKPL